MPKAEILLCTVWTLVPKSLITSRHASKKETFFLTTAPGVSWYLMIPCNTSKTCMDKKTSKNSMYQPYGCKPFWAGLAVSYIHVLTVMCCMRAITLKSHCALLSCSKNHGFLYITILRATLIRVSGVWDPKHPLLSLLCFSSSALASFSNIYDW